MYEVNGVKYDENINQNKANTEQGWNTQEQQPYMGTQRNKRMQENIAEEVYVKLDEHMQKALSFHEQLADYFCFLGLQGFKRKLECQYMDECANKRKLHHKYINIHQKLIPLRQVQFPQMIPRDWSKYTTDDVNDSVLPKFVKNAMEQYKQWEHETKELYEEQWQKCMNNGMGADADYISKLIQDVTKELKEINRMCEQLNGTGYDVIAIHSVQDKYHNKYKNKYNDTYTDKWKKKETKHNKTNK